MISDQEPSIRSKKLPRIVRPTATTFIEGYCRQHEHRVYRCHRYERRTVPCLGSSCLLCASSIPRDDRIFLPFKLMSDARLVVVDLPASFHGQLKHIRNEACSLMKCRMHLSRVRPEPNARILLRASRLKSDDELPNEVAGFDDVLDAIFAKNVAFAFETIRLPKMAATG